MKKILGVSKTVFTLGIVSLLTDVSSEMLVTIVPQFLRFALHTRMEVFGLIESMAEATASLLRVFAGWLADRAGRPKALTVAGYGLSSLSKPFFLIANAWPQVLGIRLADRFGKGIRSAPRDVLIADATDPSERGRAFGVHRAMDTTGAVIGPLAVAGIIYAMFRGAGPVSPGMHYRPMYNTIFLAATVPAVLAVVVLAIFVPEKAKRPAGAAPPRITLGVFSLRFKLFLAAVTIFALGNSSDAFLIARATSRPIGFSAYEMALVFAAFNVVGAVVSLRSGIVSDRIGRKPLIVAGLFVFAAVYAAFAFSTSRAVIWGLFMIYGVYYGLTEGVFRAYAVDLAPPELRGTALGAYYTFTGVALLPASIFAGFLWETIAPWAAFVYGSAMATVSAVMLILLVKGESRVESGEWRVESGESRAGK